MTEPVRPTPPAQLRIGLWGPPGSGKTTFLAALKVATFLQSDETNWIMNGSDDATNAFLESSVHQLTTDKTFPPATDDDKNMIFRFTGEQPVARRNRFGKRIVEKQRVAFELDVLDVPGRRYDTTAANRPASSEADDDEDSGFAATAGQVPDPYLPNNPSVDNEDRLLDHLQSCHGIVYLFDPERDAREGDAFRYFHPVLERLARRVLQQDHYQGTRLPHHVAVCVTKFDQPNIYHKAKVKGYTVLGGERPFLPRVDDALAADFFRMLCDDPLTNTDLVERGLRKYFGTLRYFVTSSIGFYVADGRFRPHDCMNVERVGSGSGDFKIKGKVYPINVLEPLLWLQQSIREAH